MRKLFFSLICSFFLYLPLSAQDIGNYELTQKEKVGQLTDMSGSTPLIGPNQVDFASQVTSIGFDFLYMGKIYNSFSVNTNGVLRLGGEAVLPNANTYGIPGNDRIVPLAGYAWVGWFSYEEADLKTNNNGSVHYKVLNQGVNSAPNRVLVVEWKNVGLNIRSGNSNGTFQVRLYESALNSLNKGRIEFVYDNFDLPNSWTSGFYFRTGFGIGPEEGNFVAINHGNQSRVYTANYLSGLEYNEISSFTSNSSTTKRIYRFDATRKPSGSFSDFELICPAPNAITIRFNEDCPDEAGIAVYRKLPHQPDNQFRLVATLPPDARTFSDGDGIGNGARYTYRFYHLGEGNYSDTKADYTTESLINSGSFQAVSSGEWTNAAVWGGSSMPSTTDDVEIGCANSVFISADGNAQVRNLTVHQGSFLTIEDGVTLHVSGDFVNNGVFNPQGTGRLVLNGSNQQSITNNGQGITDDDVFTSNNNRPNWGNNSTGQVAEKTLSVNSNDFTAIKSVKVDITHDYLRDLSVYLVAPNGQQFTLSRGRGQRGHDYDNVVFTETGRPLPPTIQTVYLSGEYRPEESFANYNGQFNGTWRLRVRDDFSGVGGRLNTFELTLSKGSTNDLVMRNITIDNQSTAGVTLNSGIVVQEGMALNQGVVHASENATVLLEAGAACNEGNVNSYIDGPVLKRGDTPFVFPLGDEGVWAPLTIENFSNANTSTTFKASYRHESPASTDLIDNTLHHVSGLEYWELSPVSGTPTVDMVLHWKDAEVSDIQDITSGDLTVAHFSNGTWINEGGEVVAGSAVGPGGAGSIRIRGINTFSPFTFASHSDNNKLPVEFLSFTGHRENNGVVLQWKTASELNNSHFEVERSTNGFDWEMIGAVEGNGTTQQLRSYQFNDQQALNSRSFYRLKQVDYDGAFEYSSIVSVQAFAGDIPVHIYPNPAKDEVTIETSLYPALIVLSNQNGVEILRSRMEEGMAKLQLPDLATGVYTIQLRHQFGIHYQRIIIKP